MKKYNVVFCGTPEIGATILKQLMAMETLNVCLVVSQPDRPVGRKKEILPTPVKQVALEHNLKIIQPNKIGDDYQIIKQANPDFIITCAYGQFIPEKILQIPTLEALNVHGSLLPKYRGGAPIQYAIWKGETITGISLMRMVKKMDAGPYFAQKQVEITPDDDSGTLFQKMAIAGAELVKEALVPIALKQLPPIEQNEAEVTFCKNITSAEEKIAWEQSATEILNQIRALSPTPNAYTELDGVRFKIHQARLLTEQDLFPLNRKVHFPGEILYLDQEGIIVQTGDQLLKLLIIQKAGKTPINAGNYAINNTDISIGGFFNERFQKK
ncbi:methionyl-tRNA formyltransferase [Williamsoniiplasma lucivorax]|uniref:Methionyl-tRNA formyltransferase n=2 Tax=Williamsoniiplasma lucivorax TaxID=209274 RepID=A0A2S5RDC7_9MOLU|nr:methionyl-tRNA formyltransferase [Williamsoniiplasma lucivorax]PPE05212.1 methionyl-tRNA formyltransferase [Williamsoniiplasma lucivorax]